METFSKVVMFVLLTTILVVCCIAFSLIATNVAGGTEIAAWVQAIGGIAAIVAAVLIGQAQTTASLVAVRETHKLSSEREVLALLAVSSELVRMSRRAVEVYGTRNELAILMSQDEFELPLDTLIAELRELKGREFQDRDALSEIIALKVHAAYLKTMLRKAPLAAKLMFSENNSNKFEDVLAVIELNWQEIESIDAKLGRRFQKGAQLS